MAMQPDLDDDGDIADDYDGQRDERVGSQVNPGPHLLDEVVVVLIECRTLDDRCRVAVPVQQGGVFLSEECEKRERKTEVCPKAHKVCPKAHKVCPKAHKVCLKAHKVCPKAHKVCPKAHKVCLKLDIKPQWLESSNSLSVRSGSASCPDHVGQANLHRHIPPPPPPPPPLLLQLHLCTPSRQLRSSADTRSECHSSEQSPVVSARSLITRPQLSGTNSLFLSVILPLLVLLNLP